MSYPTQPAVPPLEFPHYGIDFTNAVKRVFKKYSTFTGRASRGEYWWWFLAYSIIQTVLYILTLTLGLAGSPDGGQTPGPLGAAIGLIYLLVTLGVFLPTLAVAVRRLHDAGYSGWYYLLGLIPLVGFIILIVFLAKPTSPQGAQYDPAPMGGYYTPAQPDQFYGQQPGGYPQNYDGGYGQSAQPGEYPQTPEYPPSQGYPPVQDYPQTQSYPPAQNRSQQ